MSEEERKEKERFERFIDSMVANGWVLVYNHKNELIGFEVKRPYRLDVRSAYSFWVETQEKLTPPPF